MDNFRKGVLSTYNHLNDLTGDALAVIIQSIRYFNHNRGPEAAAVVSYYSLFSLFPLLIFIVAGLSFFLGIEAAQEQVTQQIQTVLPISTEFITQNIQSILRQRTSFSLLGLMALLWSATGMFNTLVLHINRAWPQANTRNFIHSRFIAILIVSGLVALLFLSLAFTTILDLLPLDRLLFWETISPGIQQLYHFLTQSGPFILRLLIPFSLYRFVPNTRVRSIPAFLGALITALAWEISTRFFTWYLSSGYTSYEVIYGSLGRIAALLIWIYISSWLLIIGAYLTAAFSQISKGKSYSYLTEVDQEDRIP